MFHARVPLSPQQVADLMITALEGGSSYWCSKIRVVGDDDAKFLDEAFWTDLKPFQFRLWIPDDMTDEMEIKIVDVTPESVNAALSKLVGRRGGFDIENYDAYDADYFFQCLVLGEVVYG